MQYLDADGVENLIVNANVLGSLDRNAITVDNTVDLTPNIDNIFPSSELFPDHTYTPKKSWWELHRKELFIIGTLLVFLVAVAFPGFGLPMMVFAAKYAISSAVIGGIIGGLISVTCGSSFINGFVNSFVNGLITGFLMGAALFCVASAIGALVGACNRRSFYTVQNSNDIARLRTGGEPWPTGNSVGGNERALLGEGIYGWDNKADARAYLKALEAGGAKDLKIYKFTISKADLAGLKTFNMFTAGDDAANALLNTISNSGISGYQHIIRQTGNFGFEYFFDKLIIDLLRF